MLERIPLLRHLRRLIRRDDAAIVAPPFDEVAYLAANPDVAAAVKRGEVRSGRQHFEIFGKWEHRPLGATPKPPLDLGAAKARKLARIRPLLRTDMPLTETPQLYDFLTEALRSEFNIIDTDAVSSHNYDAHVLGLIERHQRGLVLDCGAGRRSVYYENVVNFEIAAYETTDVRGVAEMLPFVDGAFDAVISIAVLEHVKDPFRCAREIVRVLKPGGDLICCVPFLQPYHGYPHHYYNMTHQGLRNLFAEGVVVDQVLVYGGLRPISALTWIVGSWARGLRGSTREQFLDMRLRELLAPATSFFGAPFVTELSEAKNLELASACVLLGHKPSN
jgi:SAM-dependent methyltransferase